MCIRDRDYKEAYDKADIVVFLTAHTPFKELEWREDKVISVSYTHRGEDFSGKMGDSIRTEIGTLVINFTKYWND